MTAVIEVIELDICQLFYYLQQQNKTKKENPENQNTMFSVSQKVLSKILCWYYFILFFLNGF